MKPDRLKKLFTAAARAETPPGADDLPERIARRIRQETFAPAPTLFEQLGLLLPRAAVLAVAVLMLCAAIEFLGADDWSAAATQLSEQWLFAVN
jgi:hypothetical protein